jgi:transcriptional regulator with XRE-family HTH domain
MDEDTIIATFCQKLKTLRLANGLTLEELGDMSGVSISTISKIENRQQKPSFETVLRVSRALHINFVQMLEPPTPPRHMARRIVTRAGDEPKLVSEHYTYATHAAEITNKAMVPSLMQIRTREVPPRDQWNTHQGEEFIFVLSGTLEFHTEEYTPVLLHKGDSCYLDSAMRHAFVAQGDADVNILTIFMSPVTAPQKSITKDGLAAKDSVAADGAIRFGG